MRRDVQNDAEANALTGNGGQGRDRDLVKVPSAGISRLNRLFADGVDHDVMTDLGHLQTQ